MSDYLGSARCPVCGTPGQQLTLTKKGLSLLTCMAKDCKCQIFARGPGSDEKLRDLIDAPAIAKPTIDPEPKPEAKPAATPPAPPAPPRKKIGWGVFAGQEA